MTKSKNQKKDSNPHNLPYTPINYDPLNYNKCLSDLIVRGFIEYERFKDE